MDQIVGSPGEGGIVEEQTDIIENTTSFLEIPRKETIVSLKEIEEEKVQTKTLTPIYHFKTRDNSLIKPFFTKSNFETKTFSLFSNMAGEEEERVLNEPQEEDEEQTFGFPILDLAQNTNMKNINPSILPTFHGMSTKDPDAFLFEFDILCRSYNYINDAQKLKLFPATLKDVALRWFTGLREYTIRTWDQMKSTFLKKYQDYSKSKDAKNDIFKMQQLEDKTIEDYLKRFFYNYKKSKQRLNDNTIRTIFLKGIKDEYIDTLNLMGAGDISQLNFEEINNLCRK